MTNLSFKIWYDWHHRFTGENIEKTKILYSRIEKLAEKHECKLAKLTLAWILHQGDNVVPIHTELFCFFAYL